MQNATTTNREFVCYYCGGYTDGCEWKGTRVVSVMASDRDDAKAQAEEFTGKEILRVVEI